MTFNAICEDAITCIFDTSGFDYASSAFAEGAEVRVAASSPTASTSNRPRFPRIARFSRKPNSIRTNLRRRYSGVERTYRRQGTRLVHSRPDDLRHGRIIGDLVFSTNGDRPLSLDDSRPRGRRIGMYVKTARAFERQRDIAHSLQRCFLPVDIPAVPGR